MDCPCDCHGRGAYAGCSVDGVEVPGGCGSVYHRADEPTLDTAHRCRRHDDCPDGERVQLPGTDATVRVGARIATADGLCPTCERVVCSAIAQLPRDWVRLHGLLAAEKSGWPDGELVSGSRELKIPIRTYVEALMREIADEVTFWAAVVEPEALVPLPRSARSLEHRAGVLLGRAAAVLERHAPFWTVSTALGWHSQPVWTSDGTPDLDDEGFWTTTMTDALSGALRLHQLHERAQSLAGLTEVVTPKPLPCPRCQTQTLVHRNGTDVITCIRCESRWPESEYRALCLGVAEGVVQA